MIHLTRLLGFVKIDLTIIIFFESSKKMSSFIPNENINICFVGGVSTGKSTGLNGVFCQQLTECKIKRTTMVPTIYVENDTSDTSAESILKTIAETNAELITQTENGKKINECKELMFNVGKLDINILDDSHVNIYDIPGLNDARTKDTYYEYLDTNFFRFNVILFFIDINSGLNTSDEMEILKFICTKTKNEIENNNRMVYTMVIVNKADDMQLDNDKLKLMGEMEEMFSQVIQTVNFEFNKHEIMDNLIDVMPMCAIDAYLYRMVKNHGDNFKLSPQQIQKIGINEMGKKFSMKKLEVQEKEVTEILKDRLFIDSMIQLSGFSQLETALRKFLCENDVGRSLRIDNILYSLRHLPDIKSVIHENGLLFDHTSWMATYSKIYNQIKHIDKTEYTKHINKFIDIMTLGIEQVIITNTNVTAIVNEYDYFVKNMIIPYFGEFYDSVIYPGFLTKHLITCIGNHFENDAVEMSYIVDTTRILREIDCFDKQTMTTLFSRLLNNKREINSINFGADYLHEDIIELFDNCCKTDVDLSSILRFVVMNQFQNNNHLQIHEKIMIYQRYGEIPVSNYLNCIRFNGNALKASFNETIVGLTGDIISSEKHTLDIYYLNYEKRHKTLNIQEADAFVDCV